MSGIAPEHPLDETLELYALVQLNQQESEWIEEHLLVCRSCQDRLIETERFIASMKQACRDSAAAPSQPTRRLFARWANFPAPVWAGAGIGVLLMASLPFVHSAPKATGETEIYLAASRGATEGHASAAAAALRLTIDTSQLPATSSYRVAVVSTAGTQLWQSDPTAPAPLLSVAVPVNLRPGRYWVRVSGPDGQLLREFQLEIS